MRVTETLCKTALREFTYGKAPGEPTYTVNPYRGCGHGCVYCYAPSLLHEEREWGSFVEAKINAPQVLAREVADRRPGLVFFSSATDPYQPAEGRYRLTRRCLQILLHHRFPVRILTRSPLVLRDLDLLEEFRSRGLAAEVGFSIPSAHDLGQLEPRVPPVGARLRALKTLSSRGVSTWVSLAPILPDITESGLERLIASIAEAGARKVYSGPLRLAMYPQTLIAVASKSDIDCYRDEGYYRLVLQRVSALCEAHGLEFKGYAEEPTHANANDGARKRLPRQATLLECEKAAWAPETPCPGASNRERSVFELSPPILEEPRGSRVGQLA